MEKRFFLIHKEHFPHTVHSKVQMLEIAHNIARSFLKPAVFEWESKYILVYPNAEKDVFTEFEAKEYLIEFFDRMSNTWEKTTTLTEDEEYMFNLAVKLIIDYIRNKKGWNYSGYQAFFKDELIKDLQRECEFYPGSNTPQPLQGHPSQEGNLGGEMIYDNDYGCFSKFLRDLKNSSVNAHMAMVRDYDRVFYLSDKKGNISRYESFEKAISIAKELNMSNQ